MKKTPNNMSCLAQCEKCEKTFELNNQVVAKQRYLFNEQALFISHYDCPYCGQRHYVQVDNSKTNELLKDLTRQMAKFAVAKRKGNEVPQKQSAKFKKNREYLTLIRNNLMKELAGKTVINSETNESVELRFSI